MKRLVRCGAALLAVVLCGCGQKGPLYIPDVSTPVLVAPAAPVSVVPPGTTQQPEAEPPAGAAQGTTPQAERSKSSK
jgi:predicted small lipoprotein YifL